ncbi:MAG: CoA-binding protein [Bacteroidetes bacterium]|nr:CoA-binding protein [Bacteroidota bacterium]MBK9801194.1 CoA-binding protein [Bacteroidota bacterium]MBP6411879.1 CoA-binding protein [Bacteroidia bacterium]
MKKTLIIGASENPTRYSNQAAHRLLEHGFAIEQIGKKEGMVEGVKIETGTPLLSDIDTVTLYINPTHQKNYYSYILNLKPRRIIFNPGTENPELVTLAQQNNIQTEEACTLVLLSIGAY